MRKSKTETSGQETVPQPAELANKDLDAIQGGADSAPGTYLKYKIYRTFVKSW